MASQTLKRRPKHGPSASSTKKSTRAQKLSLARKGLRSLSVAIAIPATLTAFTVYVSGGSASFASMPTWHPPVWAFHLASVSMAGLMGISAWLVWAEGVFHEEPEVLGLYLIQLLLGLIWAPLVFGLGLVKIGLVVCAGLFVVMFICAQCFRTVNPTAGNLVKPCLAWVSFLAVFNYKLLG